MQTIKENRIYLNGLNGIRAIAAIAVVFSHTTQSLSSFKLDPYLFGRFVDGGPKGLLLAGYGVSMFFVLSGFLITYLLEEEMSIAPIDIRKFYVRRILRIWPLYYLYLGITLIVLVLQGYNFNLTSLSCYVLFSANVPFILETGMSYLGHYWSLGVEEQFYLFWPWLIKKFKTLIFIVFALTVILIGLKISLHLFYPNSLLEKIIHVTRFHCMMIGGLGAILYRKRVRWFMKTINNYFTQGLCWLILLLLAINKYHFISFLDNEFLSFVILFVIIGQIEGTKRIINLEVKPLVFLGKISYGLYVIHPMMILLFSYLYRDMIMPDFLKYVIIYVSVISITILLSFVSFNTFEKYFLSLKKRFEVVKTGA